MTFPLSDPDLAEKDDIYLYGDRRSRYYSTSSELIKGGRLNQRSLYSPFSGQKIGLYPCRAPLRDGVAIDNHNLLMGHDDSLNTATYTLYPHPHEHDVILSLEDFCSELESVRTQRCILKEDPPPFSLTPPPSHIFHVSKH
ncbi:hypothetical protein Moror_2145 [Moniliophthora roreri MCA 2997]|uniref:Uncharacterized protein n=1 Tax=Moniliophthora roreri (strain MCA 2997) TaxID=1381753 RepID=V2WQ40_MONRO|nr:hypothetical protein Moror_2145 [Moniliophthora roreri MCA 2997]